jgi:hypothetical protein
MYWVFAESFAINKTTGVRLIIRVILDDLTLKNTHEDLVKGQTVGLRLFVSVVCNSYSIVSYCLNNVLEIHGNSRFMISPMTVIELR